MLRGLDLKRVIERPRLARRSFRPVVYPLAPLHVQRAEETLVNAFMGDPVTEHLFPVEPARRDGLRRVLRVGLRHGLCYGEVDNVDEGDGVAIWLQSEHSKLSLAGALRTGMLIAAWELGMPSTLRVLAFLRYLEKQRLRAHPGLHWYLLDLAVCPERQSRGLGTSLLKHGLMRADAQQLPCYLETSNEPNVDFYMKHGFRVIGCNPSPGAGPSVWNMVRH